MAVMVEIVRCIRRVLVCITVALQLIWPAGVVAAGAATEQLRGRVDQTRRILDDAELKKNSAARGRALRRVADQIFDFEESAKRSLSSHWHLLSPEQRAAFVQSYANLLERAYISKTQLWDGEKIAYVSEVLEIDHAIVRARITTRGRSEIPVDFKMLQKGNRWLAYDVVIEGVSLVENYQTQFAKIIRTSSFEALLTKMRTIVDSPGK